MQMQMRGPLIVSEYLFAHFQMTVKLYLIVKNNPQAHKEISVVI